MTEPNLFDAESTDPETGPEPTNTTGPLPPEVADQPAAKRAVHAVEFPLYTADDTDSRSPEPAFSWPIPPGASVKLRRSPESLIDELLPESASGLVTEQQLRTLLRAIFVG